VICGQYGDEINNNNMDGACITHGKLRNTHRIVTGKPEKKRSLARLI
jgi:hypothetical protein